LFVLRGLQKLSVSGTIVGCPEVEGIIRHSTVLEDLKLFQSGLEFGIKRDVLHLDRYLGTATKTLKRLCYSVLCDESGHTKFPFSYLAHVTLLTPAQVRLGSGSGFAQACCHT